MADLVFPRCHEQNCQESAISFSKYCWRHSDKEAYLKNLPNQLKSLSPQELYILNFKKVEAENLDFSHLVLKGSSFAQAHIANTLFVGTDLFDSDFIGAKLRSCDFVGTDLRNTQMTKATLSACSLSHSDMREANLSECHLRDVDFMGTLLWGCNLWNADLAGAKHLKRKNFHQQDNHSKDAADSLSECHAQVARESYRNISHYFYEQGHYEDASWAAYKELIMERKHFYEKKDPRFLASLLMDILSGYTEKPNRVILSSFGIIILFGVLYYFLGAIRSTVDQAGSVAGFWDSLYFSFISFTTVGFGDFVPQSRLAIKFLVSLEAFSGPFMMGLYVFTLTRRYAAR